MEEREKQKKPKPKPEPKPGNKKQKHNEHPNYQHPKPKPKPKPGSDISFKPTSDLTGIKFGAQFIVKSFTVRKSRPLHLSFILNLSSPTPFLSTIAFIPTNFTILAHHAWHTLTLGLGTKKSKVIIFVFDTVAAKSAADLTWPAEIPLGEVNRRLIRGLTGCEAARFKFRKGCITFYVFAVRKKGEGGFQCGEELRVILHSVSDLNDFVDHTAMLAFPDQRAVDYNGQQHPLAAH